MTIEIQPLRDRYLSAAAALVARRYADLRRATPHLPTRYEEAAELLPRLRDLARRAPGAAALRDGRLVGFLTGYLLDQLRRQPGVFSPEWANAAEPDASRAIYEALYTAMAPQWVGLGYRMHGLSLFAHDREGLEAWRWLGFGLGGADAVRDLAPIGAPDPGLRIARAGPADFAQVAALDAALHRHLMATPVYLPLDEPGEQSELAAELADPAFAFWVAWDGAEAAAYMKFGPATDTACTVIVDPGTTSITGAFTLPAARGRGVGAALLEQGLAWAREAGYVRCSVDFEPMNIPAARFWLGHFRLVCLAQLRPIF